MLSFRILWPSVNIWLNNIELALWPKNARQRTRARCMTAEMYSGFLTQGMGQLFRS